MLSLFRQSPPAGQYNPAGSVWACPAAYLSRASPRRAARVLLPSISPHPSRGAGRYTLNGRDAAPPPASFPPPRAPLPPPGSAGPRPPPTARRRLGNGGGRCRPCAWWEAPRRRLRAGRAIMAAAPSSAGRSVLPRVLPAVPGGGCPGAHLGSLGPPFPTKAF